MTFSIEQVWNNTMQNLKDWYWSAVAAYGIGYLLPLIVILATLFSYFAETITVLATQEEVSQEAINSLLTTTNITAGVAAWLVLTLLAVFVYSGLLRSLVRAQAPYSWRSILAGGAEDFLRLLAFGLVYFCIFAGPMVILFLVLGGAVASGMQSAFYLLALMFLFIPVYFVGALVLGVYWAVDIIVYYKEPGILNAFSKSYRLVKGRWWMTLGALLILVVISIGANLATIPFSIAAQILMLFSIPAALVVEMLGNVLVPLFLLPFTLAYIKGLYDALADSRANPSS